MRDRELDRLFERFRRRGDVEALGQVFDHAAPELLRVARHLVGNAAEAEDMVQSTFVTAIERAREFDVERRLVPWLVGILAHHAANARRRRVGDELDERTALAPDASELAQERELRSKLRAIVAELPEVLRTVVAQHLIQGKRPQEIAVELGLSPGATRVRLHRGLERVRRALPVGFATGAIAVSVTSSRGLAAVRAEVLGCAQGAAPALAASATSTATSIWLGGSLVLQRIALAAAAVAVVAGSIWFFGASPRGSRASASLDAPPSSLADVAEPARATLDATRDEATARELAATEPGIAFEGRVVDYATNEPLAGARVWTMPVGATARLQRATTAADGTFEFRASAAEEASLFVEADGYAPTRPPLSETLLAEFRARAKREVLDGGSRVRLYELRLVHGVAFEGRVVLAVDRSPVADAELVLGWKEYGALSAISDHAVGRTDALGVMHFDGLLPEIERDGDGSYALFAVADAGLGWTYVARSSGRAAIGSIEIAIEPPFELDLSVRDESGAAVAGALVHCVPTHPPFSWLPSGQFSQFALASSALSRCFTATTGADGVARLHRLTHSSRTADGLLQRPCFLVFADAPGVGSTRAFLQFGAGDSASHSLVLVRDTTTRIRGRVLDERGVGIEGASVHILAPERACATRADGSYEIAKLPTDPVRVDVEASKPGLTTARRNIDQAAFGGVVDEQDFVLRTPLTIEGRIVDDRGAPIAGLEVNAFGAGGESARTGEDGRSAVDGSFRLEGASEGDWELYPVASQRLPEFEGLVWPSHGVRARGGERGVQIVLERRATAHGRIEIDVVDADSGAPLDPIYAVVFASDDDGPHVEPRRAPGKVLCDGVETGGYTAWIAVAGRSNGVCEVRLAPDELVARGRVEIARPARLRGRVDWSRFAQPLPADLEAHFATKADIVPGNESFARGTAFSTRVKLAPGDDFDLRNLTAGPWRLQLSSDGVRDLHVDVELRPGEQTEVVLTPEPGGVIEFVAGASPKRGWIVFELGTADGAWREYDRTWDATADPLPTMRVTVDPGRVRWRAWFLAENDIYDKKHVAEPREGELDVAARQVVRVPLEVVLVE